MQLEEIKKASLIRIVDDDEHLANALKFFLEIEGWKCEVYNAVTPFLINDRPSIPGCVVLDVRMPEVTGLECQKRLNERHSTLPVVFISGHGDIDMAVQAVLDGAVDFVQKPLDEDRLLRSIIKAATRSVETSTGKFSSDKARELWSKLTDREHEIIRLVVKGLVNRVIGERLGIATRTVEVHRANALKKLGVKDVHGLRLLIEVLENEATEIL